MESKQSRIEYTKVFMGGTLKGMRVRCHYDVPSADVVSHELALQKLTPDNPGHDVLTHVPYWVSNVGSFPVEVN